MKRKLTVILAVMVIALFAVTSSVLASSISVVVTVTESGSNSYTKLPIMASADVEYLADNGFVDADGLDALISKGGSNLPLMLAEDRINFVSDISADSITNFDFTTGNTPRSNSEIVLGDGGYITTADSAGLEGGNSFESEIDGYFDTTAGNGNILYKNGSLQVAVDAVTNGEIDVSAPGAITGYSISDVDSGVHNIHLTVEDYDTDGVMTTGTFYPNTTSTVYVNFMGSWDTTYTASTSTTTFSCPFPASGTISNLVINTQSAPGVGNSWTYTWYQSGSPTSLTATVSGTDTTASDTTHSEAISLFTTCYLEITTTGSPVTSTYMSASIVFTPTSSNYTPGYMAKSGTSLGSSTKYYSVTGGQSAQSSYGYAETVVATDCTIMYMKVLLSTPPGSGNSRTFTIYKNGTAQSITGTATTTPIIQDTSNSFTCSAGDRICVRTTYSGSPPSANFVMCLGIKDPANNGEQPVGANTAGSNLASSGTNYLPFSGMRGYLSSQSLNETVISSPSAGSFTVEKLYARVSTMPGGSTDKWTFTLYKNDSPTALTCYISYLSTSSSDTSHSVSVESGDILYWVVEATDTPSSAYAQVGALIVDNYTGSYLKTYIDDVEEGSEALVAGLTDNSNDWVIGGDAVTYLNYYSHTVSDVEVMRYEPTSIISGTTMPDEINSYDGTITWGTNPAGIAITYGSFISSTTPTISDVGGESTDMAGETGQPGLTETFSSMSSHPLYPLINVIATTTTFPEQQVWIFFALAIILTVMLAVFKFTQHILLVAGAGFATTALAYQQGIFAWWVLILFAILAVTVIVWEQRPSM